ncbi:hypothetical protein SDC9_197626 [bioreactor metagenome]|uniref:Uncharacterized protein n=1 Tax=bioreactor metagenome TaxID=1076179 RepID=A0A645IFA2_9ZZZZ
MHAGTVKPSFAEALPASAEFFQHTPNLRLKEDKQHDDDGAGGQNRIQQPAQYGQRKQLRRNGAQKQQPNAFEHLVSTGLLCPDDELIDQYRDDGNVESVLYEELRKAAR